MTKDEALRMALEALQDYVDEYGPWSDDSGAQYVLRVGKEALAQQSNISELKEKTANHNVDCLCADCSMLDDLEDATAQPEQEPVAFVKGWNCGRLEVIVRSLNQRFEIDQPLYITPPQRTWVGLTVDEVWQSDELMALNAQLGCSLDLLMEVVEAIEAKLKEKNT